MPLQAQTTETWRKVGTTAVETGLAGPAGGPIRQVWFSEDGTQLFVRTNSGKPFVSSDFASWTAAPVDSVRWEMPLQRSPSALPERQMNLREGGRRLYAFGTDVYASDDSGRTWINLTALNGHSIIGDGQHDVAVSPLDPLFIAVANDSGIWASHDGGLSWAGLNENLPNLPVRALLPGSGMRVEGIGDVMPQGRSHWVAMPTDSPEPRLRAEVSLRLGTEVTSVSGAGDFWYAGTADGRIFSSTDARGHWTGARSRAAGPVEKFFVDPELPRIAFAAASSRGAHLFRTINGGVTWDDITGLLGDVPAHGVAVDRADGAVYVATDRGVFLSRMDVNVLGPASPWARVSPQLPDTVAEDVALDSTGRRITVALDGYGLYQARAPHQSATARLVNAADFSLRAAAPGGLVSSPGLAVYSASGGGREFPVLSVSPEGSQIQIPFGTEPSQIAVELNRSQTVNLTVKAVAPALFVDPDGAPLLLDSDTGMMLDSGSPIASRAVIQLLVTGLGRVTPDWPTGTPAPSERTPTVVAEVQAFLNGNPLEVTKATLAPGYVGMYLVEVRLPALLDAGVGDLYLVAGGEGSNHVRVLVENRP